jgi:hypothetical protein
MDIHEALERVGRWCAAQTALGDPEEVEVECHATVWITIGECSPPWRVRYERQSSAGASAPVAQLRYDAEARQWSLHHGERLRGWCDEDDAIHDGDISKLLEEVERGRNGRFLGLPPGLRSF